MKNIVVCMKQVLDPEAPLSLFKIDPEARQAILPKATPPVLSPFDENALEAALKIKDTQSCTVSVVTLGKKLSRAVVKSPLAACADRLFILEDESFSDFNINLTAAGLAAAIKKIGPFDLILCGLQAADTNAGQVGICLAALLGIPCLYGVRRVELSGDKVRVERATPDGFETLETVAPAVVTVNYEVGALREPGVEAFMSANKKPLTVWNAQALGLQPDQFSRLDISRMFQPAHEAKCVMIEGASGEEKAVKLADRLKQSKVI